VASAWRAARILASVTVGRDPPTDVATAGPAGSDPQQVMVDRVPPTSPVGSELLADNLTLDPKNRAQVSLFGIAWSG
jgi:hypothetical protein